MDDPNIDPTLVYPDSSDHAYDLPYRHSPTFASALLVTPDRDGTRGGGNGSSGKRARGEIKDGEAGRVKKTRQSRMSRTKHRHRACS